MAVIVATVFIMNVYGSIINRIEDIELYEPKDMHEDILLMKKDLGEIKEFLIPDKYAKQ